MLKDNFYLHVNEKWLKNNPIPKKYTKWGSFQVLFEENLKKIKHLIKYKTNNEKYSKIKILYNEFMNRKKINTLKLKPIQKYINLIMNCKTKLELWNNLGKLHKYGIPCFFSIYAEMDSKNNKKVVLHLASNGLGLPDRDYYFKDYNIILKYQYYIKNILSSNILEDLKLDFLNIKSIIFKIEKELAKVTFTRVDQRDPKLRYNKMNLNELENISNLDWKIFLSHITNKEIPYIIVDNPKFYIRLAEIWNNISLMKLKYFIKYKLIANFTHVLNDYYLNLDFNFYAKTLRGQQLIKPIDEQAISLIDNHLGELLGQLYIKNHFNKESKIYLEKMVKKFNNVFKKRINNLDWMSNETKINAHKKNEAFKYKIGYPEVWREYNIDLNKSNLIDMILELRLNNFNHNMRNLNGKPDLNEWEMNTYEVNAYFHPLKNEIVFPAGILQKPYFDLNNSDSQNYGGIGVIIGHEMSHSYDDKGSKYDWNGELNNWWKEEDLIKFKKKTLYYENEFNNSVYKGKNINGKLTLGENIADHGGIKIAYQALLEKNQNLSKKEKQNFFITYAKIWKNNITDEEANHRIITDPHALGLFRVNTTLANIKEFHEVFNINENDHMYRKKPEFIWG